MSLNHLLPPAGIAPRCADFTAANNVDSAGTAIRADLLLLVEVGLPWPKPIGSHAELVDLMALGRASKSSVKILACEPTSATKAANDAMVVHTFHRGDDGSVSRFSYRFARDEALERVDQILLGRSDAQALPRSVESRPALLVCTQGSHDVCCGERGHGLADGASERFPGIDVFRVSHTGGHRFAPTAFTFPDGRMWAFLSLDDLESLFNRSVEPRRLAPKCRGWWGAPVGPGQVAERAVFASEPWGYGDEHRTVTVRDPVAGVWGVEVETPVRSWRVEVEVGREIPTITCSADGGLPVKPGREYRVRSLVNL